MKSSWIGIGFSHHNVPSLSNTATRSSTGTASGPSPHTRPTNSTIACLTAPSRHPGSSLGWDETADSVSGSTAQRYERPPCGASSETDEAGGTPPSGRSHGARPWYGSSAHGKGGEMAEVLLFHHALGQTEGFAAFADELRQAGHTMHTPDLYDGRTFATIDEGMAHVKELGFGEIIERGVRAANELPDELVYGGFSLGVVPAQKLAQTRPGARG